MTTDQQQREAFRLLDGIASNFSTDPRNDAAEALKLLRSSPPLTGYRLLNVGEPRQEGDEWYDGLRWRRVELVGHATQHADSPVRRRFTSPSQVVEQMRQALERCVKDIDFWSEVLDKEWKHFDGQLNPARNEASYALASLASLQPESPWRPIETEGAPWLLGLRKFIKDTEGCHFRTVSDTGANLNAMLIWNRVRSVAGLDAITTSDLPYYDETKDCYVMPANSKLLTNPSPNTGGEE